MTTRKTDNFLFRTFSPFQKRASATTWGPRRTTWRTWPRRRAAVTSWVARWWSGWCPTGDRCPATPSGRCPKTKTPKSSSPCGPGPCRPWATCWASASSRNSSNRRLSRSRNLDRNYFSHNRSSRNRLRPDRPRGRSGTRSSRSRTDECPRARTATKSRILSNLVQFQTWYLFIFLFNWRKKTKLRTL